MIWLALLSLLAWLYLLSLHGGFWLARPRLDRAPKTAARDWPSVIAVVPARNEADVVETALKSLVAQDYRGPFEIRLVDDHSEDRTGAIARELVAGSAGRLTVLDAAERPPGWVGKLWALNCGTEGPGATPAYRWLTDADIEHAPDTLTRLVEKAEDERFALVSLMVRLSCVSGWEKLLIPAFVFFFQKLYPFPWVVGDRRGTSAAAGGCMLVKADTLSAAGGIQAIKGAVIDDCSLAASLRPPARQTGRGLFLGLTLRSRSIRPYSGLGEIWDMVARSAYTQLHYNPLLLLGTLVGMLLLYGLPPALLVSLPLHGNVIAAVLGGVGWLSMALAWLPTLRLYAQPAWRGLLLPLAGALYTAMTFDSARRHWQGKGAAWKGRIGAGNRPAA